MEEITTATQPKKTMTVPLAVLLVVVLLAGLTAYYFILRAGSANDPAAYLPKDVAVAVTIDLTGSSEKQAALDYVTGILKDAGVKDPQKELFKRINDEIGIDFEADVLRHLTGQGAFAVLTEMNGQTPKIVAVVSTKAASDAQTVMTTLGDKLNSRKVSFDRKEYSGFYYYGIPSGTMTSYVAQVEASVVYSNSETGIKKVMDTAKGQPSLLTDKNFTSMRKTGGSTFATLYYTGAGYYKLVSPMLAMGLTQMGPNATDAMKANIENAIAIVGNAEASSKGLTFHVKSVTKQPLPSPKNASMDSLASVAPRDAALVFSVADWSAVWNVIKEQYTNNPAFKPQLDQGVGQVKQMLGLDIYGDVLDRITALGVYYVPKRAASSQGLPGDITLVLTVDKPDVLRTSLSKINGALTMFGGIPVKEVDVAGTKVSMASMGTSGVEFADALVGNKVLIMISGTGIRQSALAAVTVTKGGGTNASSSPGFELVKGQLPSEGAGLFYGNAAPIVETFKNDIPASDRKSFVAVTNKVGVCGAASYTSASGAESTFVVPFLK